MDIKGLSWNKLTSITTDYTKDLRGKNIGFVKLLEDKIKEKNPLQELDLFQHPLYQENLFTASFNLEPITKLVTSVVITVR